MSTILITGGNRGLGFETGRQLIGLDHDVWLGAEDEQRGKAAADQPGARFVQLDVTDAESVWAAAGQVGSIRPALTSWSTMRDREPVQAGEGNYCRRHSEDVRDERDRPRPSDPRLPPPPYGQPPRRDRQCRQRPSVAGTHERPQHP